MSKTKTYKINEIFYSIQGEGAFAGSPAIFIRFSGCNLRCPFCDTQHMTGDFMSAIEIVNRVRDLSASGCHFVVFTGGEPTLFVDKNLVSLLHEKANVAVAIETNGTNKVLDEIDWVTVSPKSDFVDDAPAITAKNASEVKVVYDMEHDPAHWLDEIKAAEYYLQPCDTGDAEKNKEILDATVAYCKANPRWRISLQTQKILNVR